MSEQQDATARHEQWCIDFGAYKERLAIRRRQLRWIRALREVRTRLPIGADRIVVLEATAALDATTRNPRRARGKGRHAMNTLNAGAPFSWYRGDDLKCWTCGRYEANAGQLPACPGCGATEYWPAGASLEEPGASAVIVAQQHDGHFVVFAWNAPRGPAAVAQWRAVCAEVGPDKRFRRCQAAVVKEVSLGVKG